MPLVSSRRQFLTTAATGAPALMAGAGAAQAASSTSAPALAPNSIPVADLHRQFDV